MLSFPVRSLPRRIAVGPHHIYLVEPAMQAAFTLLEHLAAGAMPVLVHGETGVGKELAVRAVHQLSPRREGPLAAINCAAIPETLAESELFGHERGAFSGAHAARRGLFETAAGGTVFLDEVGELPSATQARLLRVLDRGAILPLGASSERTIDVRVVAATNRDLRAEVAAGRFRADLYFRLSGALVTIPPLRARPAELPYLIGDLLKTASGTRSRPVTISRAALAALAAHAWPGNVRELKHALDFAVANAGPHASTLEVRHLPPTVLGGASLDPPSPRLPPPAPVPAELPALADEIRALEVLRINQALERAGGVRSRAAALLSMPRRTLLSKMNQYGLGSALPRRQVPRQLRRTR